MKNRRGRRLAALGVVLAFGVARLTAKDDVWLRVTSPEFTLITSLSEKEAKAWAGEFAQYVAALRSYFKNTGQRPLAPLTIVIFARERDFEKYRPLGADNKPQEVAGFFSRHQSWAVAGLAGANTSENVRRTIFHEGVHWFLSFQDRINPVWLEEGLAEVFSTFQVTKTQAEWGRAIDSHVALLRMTDAMPLQRVLLMSHGDLFGDDSLRTSIVYAKSWAFVHYMIYGKHDEISRRTLGDYADLMQNGVAPDDAFRRAFGKTYEQMDALIDRYLMGGQYFVTRQPLATVAPPVSGPASPLEVSDALARLALVARRWPQAIEHARAAIAAADADPRGHEVLGLALKESGDLPAALGEFSRAKELGSRDFAPYFELGYAAQVAAGDPAGGVTLSPGEARKIANNYEKAINLDPRFILSYQNLAGVIGLAEPWGENDRQFFDLGGKLWPHDAMIRIGHAVLAKRAGDAATARTELDAVLAADADIPANARNYARRLDDAWEQQDVIERINRLSAERKYAEAIAFIAERQEKGVGAALRAQLPRIRDGLEVNLLGEKIQAALGESRWSDARQSATELLSAKAASPQMRQNARRTLDELDRRKLGLEKPAADGH